MKLDSFKKHQNFWLFSLLVIALLTTYWFEERGHLLKQISISRESELFNLAEVKNLKSIKGIKINIDREGDRYYAHENHLLLSKMRLDELFTILSNLRIKTVINQADLAKVGRAYYISDNALKLNLNFSNQELVLSLGNKLPYDQTFYLEVTKNGKTQMVIASDESPDPGVYQSDKDYQRSEAKYKRLQMLFMLTNLYFYDNRIFKDLYADESKIHFAMVEVLTFRNKKFVIDFEKTVTNPAAPKGISYFEDNWLAFHKVLTHLEARTSYSPFEPSALSEVLSQVEILDREGRKITLQVFKKFGDLNGYFMTSSLDKVLYSLKPEEARYFFVNVQDFWKKSLPPLSQDYELNLTFYDGKSEKVKIEDKQLFRVNPSNQNLKVRELEFKKLIDFIKMEGDHVSELTEKPSEILKKNVLRLNFENRALSVILEDNDAIVVDLENKLKIHHYVGASLPFGIKKADYFE